MGLQRFAERGAMRLARQTSALYPLARIAQAQFAANRSLARCRPFIAALGGMDRLFLRPVSIFPGYLGAVWFRVFGTGSFHSFDLVDSALIGFRGASRLCFWLLWRTRWLVLRHIRQKFAAFFLHIIPELSLFALRWT